MKDEAAEIAILTIISITPVVHRLPFNRSLVMANISRSHHRRWMSCHDMSGDLCRKQDTWSGPCLLRIAHLAMHVALPCRRSQFSFVVIETRDWLRTRLDTEAGC